VLGHQLAWDHFNAHVEHTLKYGYDHARGGVFNRGNGNQPASQTDKVWWVQSEMLAALADGIKHSPDPAMIAALTKLLDFIRRYQADPTDGIWYDTVAADGTPKNKAKAHSWKANYHDVRAMIKFIENFGGASK
jgi:mannose/cellobiose epimerase-like protein (N-acyl-D-glucosamine 2-epimerase family)